MEESLVGTAGQSLIRDLYHGKVNNTIRCRLCGKVSQQNEDFLDLCVSVTGTSTLEDSLSQMFLELEVLSTSNRYWCDACRQLTDAVKSSRLRHLPPILTVSLLRFNYDAVKMERYKETGNFEFPLRLDMACYCDCTSDVATDANECTSYEECGENDVTNGFDSGDNLGPNVVLSGDSPHSECCHTYELFSVVVHRGGAHGGHYHALIRDLDSRGTWSEPDKTTASNKTMHAPKSIPISTSSKVDLTSPRSVITRILLESGRADRTVSIGELSGRISSLTGESWRKKYKPRHGSFVKFLTENNDLFVYDSSSIGEFVSLVPDLPTQLDGGLVAHKLEMNGPDKESRDSTRGPVPAAVISKKQIRLESRSNEVDISSPRSVITAVLLNAGAAGLSVTDLCSRISDVTGDSWRKRYKPKHGSLVKFLGDNSDQFVHDVNGGWVTILARPEGEDLESEMTQKTVINRSNNSGEFLESVQRLDISSAVAENKSHSKHNRKRSKSKSSVQQSTTTFQSEYKEGTEVMPTLPEPVPKPVLRWFDFNDSVIRPVSTEDIQKHFSGKECAYMLFYRATPPVKNGPALQHIEIPEWLISEITAENLLLERQFAEYEEFVNVVKVEIHFGRSYECREGILRPRIGACYYMEHTADLRENPVHLLEAISELGGELVEQCSTIHVAKSLPSGGLHLYQEVTASITSSLKSLGVTPLTKLFVWNGRDVDGVFVPVGSENEPISLRFEVETSSEKVFTMTVSKNATILALKAMIANRVQFNGVENVQLFRSKGGKRELLADVYSTVSKAGLHTKDTISIRCSGSPATPQLHAPGSPVKGSLMPERITVYCENHVGDDVVMVKVEADSAASVEELKVLIMTSADVAIELLNDVRLRIRLDDLGGVGPPLHETLDLSAGRLSDGVTTLLELGKAPQCSEIVLYISVSASNELELIVDHDMAVHQLLHEILLRAGVSDGEEWHLCLSDWSGESGAVLSDPNWTVGDVGLSNGDHLFLQPGCPPPPGFLKIPVHLESSPARPCWWDPVSAMAATILPNSVGSVLVSKQSTLAELKHEIVTLLQDYEIPSPLFLRVRILTPSLWPTTILRHHNQILSKMKIGNGRALGVEVLPMEEDLSEDQIMLTVRRRLPGERSYGDWAQEVIWDTSQGATISSLRNIVADTIGEPESTIRIAKHIPERFDWLFIPHSVDAAIHPEKGAWGGVGGSKKKRKRKGKSVNPGGSSICDLSSPPFSIQDGDVIGVKIADEPGGEDSDFGSAEDDCGKVKIGNQRKDVAAVPEAFDQSKVKVLATPSRVETAIKIHVDSFR